MSSECEIFQSRGNPPFLQTKNENFFQFESSALKVLVCPSIATFLLQRWTSYNHDDEDDDMETELSSPVPAWTRSSPADLYFSRDRKVVTKTTPLVTQAGFRLNLRTTRQSDALLYCLASTQKAHFPGGKGRKGHFGTKLKKDGEAST